MSRALVELAGAAAWSARGELSLPDGAEDVPAALVLHTEPSHATEVEALAQLLVASGIGALALERPEHPSELGDRAALRALESALETLARDGRVDRSRLAVVGFGPAGTLAFLCGCASRRVAAVVDAGGSLERGALSARQPLEPLELALNLGAPVLVLHAADDPATPPAQADRIRDALGRAGKSFELERATGCGARYLDPTDSGYHAGPARAARERIVRFLAAAGPAW